MPNIGMPQPEVKETSVQALNRIVNERLSMLDGHCSRLEAFTDRLEPQPKAVANETNMKQPPISNDLEGVRHRLATLGERLDWLGQICDRLERIA